MVDRRLELVDEPRGTQDYEGLVPPPIPPDDPEAWYATDVTAQYEVYPDVVVTIEHHGDEFTYDVREPVLTAGDQANLDLVEDHFADAHLERPRTHEGAVETMEDGFDGKHELAIDRLVDCSPAARHRLNYHALARLACLGDLTPYALDDRIEVADVDGDGEAVFICTTKYS